MTRVIRARNVNDALVNGLWWLNVCGVPSGSRNGTVLVAPEPVVTEYQNPMERVLFNTKRDANPFFHLLEGLWMLAGRNDVEFVAHYAANMKTFSDDGGTLHGAYGYRWRHALGYDQLAVIVEELRKNPDSRRCVLQMWDSTETHYDGSGPGGYVGSDDLHKSVTGGLDVPCNTQCYFDTLGGKLNMTVTCRSNDVIWGCYGANAVHFSMLHEYVAACAGLPLGVYRQFSNNYHIYTDRPDVQRLIGGATGLCIQNESLYSGSVRPIPMLEGAAQRTWDSDMHTFFTQWRPTQEWSPNQFQTDFWKFTVVPLVRAHQRYREGNLQYAIMEASSCLAPDWKTAAIQWLGRRAEARAAKEVANA